MPAPRIALVGAPNSGKSTLFNRLVGRRKALVHREPGMTRDVNEEPCRWLGDPVVVVDTGGLLGPEESFVSKEVRSRVLEAVSDAAVLIFLVDARRGITPGDAELAKMLRITGKPIVVAVNKVDTPRQSGAVAEFHELGFDPIVAISAEHGLGIVELHDEVVRLLPAAHDGNEEPGPRPGEVSIAIAGRPNVGKSSLFNALLGQERAIVSDTPGTTRDAIDTTLTLGGRCYRIIDTAGLRRRGHVKRGPESLSVMAAKRLIERADVVLLVMDCTDAPTMQDLHVAGVAHRTSRPFAIILNKADIAREGLESLARAVKDRAKFAPYAPVLAVSARTGLGIDRILPQVDAIHEQAERRLPTGRLNRWLERAVAAHAPPARGRRPLKFYYAAQTATNPPAILVFTNQGSPPHFSYRRYLENSLREAFGLSLTPVILKYREKPRAAGSFGKPSERGRKRTV